MLVMLRTVAGWRNQDASTVLCWAVHTDSQYHVVFITPDQTTIIKQVIDLWKGCIIKEINE